MTEINLYVEILNSILNSPHKNFEGLYSIHVDALTNAPRFYHHLAAWYKDNGVIRDHNDLFAAHLCLSQWPQHRDVGLALLRGLSPRNVVRALSIMTDVNSPINSKKEKFFNVPRSVKTEIKRYLREREDNPRWFDRTVLSNRDAMHSLYEGLRIAPDGRAQAILFDNNPPEDSLLFVVREIAKMTDPFDKAAAIIANDIPYPIATSLIGNMTPEIVLALVSSMTPNQVINNLASLKKYGVMDNPDTRKLVTDKIDLAKKDKRVAAGRTKVSANVADVDEEIRDQLFEVADERIRSAERISRHTALALDISGSQTESIDVGKRLAEFIVPLVADDTNLYFYVFNVVADEIVIGGRSTKDIDKALWGVRPGGGTSYGSVLATLARKKQLVEQVVFVGDEDEVSFPSFVNAYEQYVKDMGIKPSVITVRIGRVAPKIERQCANAGIEFTAYEYSGDDYSLQNVTALLGRPSLSDLVSAILDYPLPQRKIA